MVMEQIQMEVLKLKEIYSTISAIFKRFIKLEKSNRIKEHSTYKVNN